MAFDFESQWKYPNPFRERIIFFEGLDKTGKTTLCRRVRFEGGHTCMFFDRGFVGRWVFWVYNREDDFPIRDWMRFERSLLSDDRLTIILLEASFETVVKRHLRAAEPPPKEVTYQLQKQLYRTRIEQLEKEWNFPAIRIDTDCLSEDDTVKRILEWTKII